jgi:hypothetical protein
MRIDRIGYGGVFSVGRYENVKLYFEALVDPDEDPNACLEALKAKVTDLAPIGATDYQREQDRMKNELWVMRDEVSRARSEYERLAGFLKANGFAALPGFPVLESFTSAPAVTPTVEPPTKSKLEDIPF